MRIFKGRHFEHEIIIWAVGWYCKYGISYRELEEMLGERGVVVDHSTIYRWVVYYAPKMLDKLKWYYKPQLGYNWRVDETYIKVRGKWAYLYRALDKCGNTIDFYLSSTSNSKAAKHFLGKALKATPPHAHPKVINTDKHSSSQLKAEGLAPSDLQHSQVEYLNNIIESDHGRLKRLIKPTLGFKSMKSAYATIKGFELMRMFKKGQFRAFQCNQGSKGEIQLITHTFLAA